MKYDLKEIKKALEIIEKAGSSGSIDVSIDPMERLIITCSSNRDGDEIKITIYQNIADQASRMATITKTTRL